MSRSGTHQLLCDRGARRNESGLRVMRALRLARPAISTTIAPSWIARRTLRRHPAAHR